jgi:hypothetical protein
MCIKNVGMGYEMVGRIKKLKISPDENQWLSHPDSGIRSVGNVLNYGVLAIEERNQVLTKL